MLLVAVPKKGLIHRVQIYKAQHWAPSTLPRSKIGHIINGHFRNLNWRYLLYIRPIFQAHVREYPRKIWPYMVQYLQFRILKLPLKTLFHLFHCIVSHIPDSKKTHTKKATCSGTRGHVPKQGLSDLRWRKSRETNFTY